MNTHTPHQLMLQTTFLICELNENQNFFLDFTLAQPLMLSVFSFPGLCKAPVDLAATDIGGEGEGRLGGGSPACCKRIIG